MSNYDSLLYVTVSLQRHRDGEFAARHVDNQNRFNVESLLKLRPFLIERIEYANLD